jgi:hypothetical protein
MLFAPCHAPPQCRVDQRAHALLDRPGRAAAQAPPAPAHVQASRPPPRNNAAQYAPVAPEPGRLAALRAAPALPAFLSRVRGDVELALLQNGLLDTLADDFACLQEEEAMKGHRSGKPVNEKMSFVDIRHCKDMAVSALRWHPSLQHKHAVRALLCALLRMLLRRWLTPPPRRSA